VLKLKTKYSDGTSHLLFSGLEFVEKLAALVPPPRIHLTRFFGCLAPNAKLRSLIVPKNEESQTRTTNAATDETPEKPKRSKRKSWAELLARVFNIDVKKCGHCGGELKIIAAIIEVSAIRKILGHLGLPDKPPDISPARLPPQMSFA
jgi:Putative transposase